jgi:hypothetical protein
MDRLLRKYERQENQVELEKELVLKDLEKLRTKIEQVNKK